MLALTFLSWLSLALAVLAQESTTIELTTKRPSTASVLPGNLVGLSLETDRWNDWTGNLSHPNEFTINLLNNLKHRTGVATPIRIGGGTEDRLIWTKGVNGVINKFPPVPDPWGSTKQLFPECDSGQIGGDWYRYSGNLPEGTSYIWGVNLAAGNSSEAIAQIREIEKAFSEPQLKHVKLEAVEIGNEPDSWAGKLRPDNWTINTYVAQYNQYVQDVTKSLHNKGLKYQLGSFAGAWNASQLPATGVFDTTVGKKSVSISEHRYSNSHDYTTQPASTWPAFRPQLVKKDYIRGNLTRFHPSPKIAHDRGLKHYLAETNSAGGHGMPGVSNSAAAALWAVDYTLQAASFGVDALYFHAGVGYNYSAFQPIDHLGRNITDYDANSKRHVLPLYTGFVAIADAIGNHRNSWISETSVDNDHLAAYSIWEGSRLARIMLINSDPWDDGSAGKRPFIDVSLSQVDVSKAKLKRLLIPSLGSYAGLSWGGQNWESYSGRVQGKERFSKLCKKGNVRIPSSSAVLVYL